MSPSHLTVEGLPTRGAITVIVLWRLYRYLVPFVTVAAATGFTFLLEVGSPESPYLFLFFVAIVISAWFAGTVPGWISVLLSILAVDYFFIPPIYVLDFSVKDLPWLAAFVGCAVATNELSLKRRRTEDELHRAHDELEQRVAERTLELRQANERLIAEIAERTRTAAALRETQSELARAARIMTVGELTSSIAHEINQPLAAVISNAEAALNWLRRSPPALPEARESLAAVVAAGGRAGDIVVRIRSLIKKGRPDLVALNINEVVDSVLTTTNDSFKIRDVVIERRLEAGLPPVLGDRVQLQQLVSNLVNNAAEAMADVFDRPRKLVVRTKQMPGNGVSIAVEDSGRGLADADAGRLFEPFYSTKAEGTGMGLSISRSIVEFHGGKISVVSSSRSGTVFHVELPAARQ